MNLYVILKKKYGASDDFFIMRHFAQQKGVCGQSHTGRFFHSLVDGLHEKSFSLDDKSLFRMLDVIAAKEELTDGELCRLTDHMAFCLLTALCRKETDERERNRIVSSLFYLRSYDFEAVYERYSTVSRLLTACECYQRSDEQTKALYRHLLARRQKKGTITKADAEEVLSGRDMRSARRLGLWYFPAAGFAFFTFFFLFGVLTDFSVLHLIVAALPLWEGARRLISHLFSKMARVYPLPKYEISEDDESAPKTLTVITTLLDEGDESVFRDLEDFYLTNPNRWSAFGLLADVKDSDRAWSEDDDRAVRWAEDKIRALNETYGHVFCLFIRKRAWSESEGRYMAEERKRGAVETLVSYLRGGNIPFASVICPEPFHRETVYVITLDSDTHLKIGMVKKLVGAMEHPYSAQYGFLQPRMDVSLDSLSSSRFVRLFCGSGGNDIYAFASYELYSACFGRGSFCGKGIFRVDAYRETISDVFPKGCILSHDLMEGERAGTLLIGELSFTDRFPHDVLAYFKRMHRWIRGDLMALLLAKKSLFPRMISRYKMAENLLEALLAPSLMLALLFSLFWPTFALPLVFLPQLLPFFFALPEGLRLRNRRTFSSLQTPFFASLFRLFFDIASLPYQAYVTADALIRELWRAFVSHQNLLQWTTASEMEKVKSGLGKYLCTMWFSEAAGLVFLLFGGWTAKALGVLWLSFPPIAYWLSQRGRVKPSKQENADQKTLQSYASDLWRFFAESVSEADSYLPPDNIQLAPSDETAHRTSPTNIGLYLLSCAAAHRFDFINEEELVRRLEQTFATLDRCESWCGHLYNWYDTRTLEVLGHRYVSTVDSGNFVACLLALEGYLSMHADKACEDLRAKCRAYAERADFSALYDKRRKLLYIGKDTQNCISGENVYDILMSEARTTAYIALSRGQIPVESYHKLSRQPIFHDGYAGLISWSGSAFEYFMPHLFLPAPKLSLSGEALAYACRLQKKDTVEGLFGRSEGAYYAFDAEMNYQYKPNGVCALAIQRNRTEERIVNPYASFLMLEQDRRAMLDNLDTMRKKGLYGRYGFYEALDATPSRTPRGGVILYSYMSHHVGMSLVACANASFDGLFRKAFMSDKRLRAYDELLEEKIDLSLAPSGSELSLVRRPRRKKGHNAQPVSRTEEENGLPRSHLISNGKMRFCATSRGDMALYNGKIALTRPSFELYGLPQMQLLVKDGSSIRLLSCGEAVEREGRLSIRGERERVSFSLEKGKSLFEMEITSSDKREKCLLLLFEPILCAEQDYLAHPAYAKLPIEAFYDEKEGIVSFRRRPKQATDRERWLAVATDASAFSFDTRKDDLLAVPYRQSDLAALFSHPFENRVGACIEPYCALKGSFERKASILIAFGHTQSEACEMIREKRQRSKKAALFAPPLAPKHDRPPLQSAEERLRERYLTMALYGADLAVDRGREPVLCPYADLWKNGISGDLPILSAEIEGTDREALQTVRLLLRVHHRLTLEGFRSDLVFLYGERDVYTAPERRRLLRLCEEEKEDAFVHKKGGVFLLPMSEREVIASFADWTIRIEEGAAVETICAKREKGGILSERPQTVEIPQADRKESGIMESDGYTIRKGRSRFPQSFLYCSRVFGTLLTQNSLGFTYFANAREKRLTHHTGQRLEDNNGERLLLKGEDGLWHDLALESKEVIWRESKGIYSGECGQIGYKIEVGVGEKDCVKLIVLTLQNKSGRRRSLSFCYDLLPLMGEKKKDARFVWRKKQDDTLFFGSTAVFTDMIGFLSGGAQQTVLEKGQSRRFLILLGVFPTGNDRAYRYYREKYKMPEDADKEWSKKDGQVLTLDSGDAEFDAMVNFFLPLQTVRARLWARSGFYQSSGAYGFRDQLQDAMALLPLDSSFCRQQILRSAARQYREGDAMHWWHEPKRGLRSRISDDRLFLPYAAAAYVRYTDDRALLDVQVPFLLSKPLGEQEEDRFEQPPFSEERASVYEHCLRAIDVSLKKGEHGLPLIGSGDWNDGFNRLGLRGKGESVWLAMFLLLVLKDFVPFVREQERKARYEAEMRELENAIAKSREKGWFLRAYDDEGRKIGSQSSEVCKIDLLSQAYYAILFGKNEKSVGALGSAMRYLYDSENRLLKLLTPAFEPRSGAGYIGSYPSGVRENGGQYTHGAVWGAWGLLAAGEHNKGAQVLKDLCPPCRNRDKRLRDAYRLEEYCLAGDVYTNYRHYGRGGWSHYTGAAGQFLRVVYEQLLGYCEEGNGFSIHPRLSDRFSSFTLTVRKKGTRYTIKVSEGVSDSILLDGKKSKNRFPFDKKEHFVEIVVEKKARM
ncbi:MAG: hypothetical protein E7655_01100 [Ruminococcaceae bacterium]|nr:hypothetical protein [Oscillospiraceae bacterium]